MTVMMPNLHPLVISDDEFADLCAANPDMRLERTAEGEVIFMPPAAADTGARNLDIAARLWIWNHQTGLGRAFDSSAGFTLPNSAIRSPDASWIRLARWGALSRQEQRRFAPICPDFVVELRSRSDSLAVLRDKMQEYMANGAELGWLIDPQERQVYVYRPGQAVDVLNDPEMVSGDPILPGFVLEMGEIFT